MGRLLLDANNSMFWLPEDAISQFEKLSFGRTATGCMVTMMDSVRLSEFRLDKVHDLIKSTADQIASTITEMDGSDAF